MGRPQAIAAAVTVMVAEPDWVAAGFALTVTSFTVHAVPVLPPPSLPPPQPASNTLKPTVRASRPNLLIDANIVVSFGRERGFDRRDSMNVAL